MNANEFIRKVISSDNVVKLPVDEIREKSKASSISLHYQTACQIMD